MLMMVVLFLSFSADRNPGVLHRGVRDSRRMCRLLRVMIGLLVCRVLMQPTMRERGRRRGETAEQGDNQRDQAEGE